MGAALVVTALLFPACGGSSSSPEQRQGAQFWPPSTTVVLARPALTVEVDLEGATLAVARLEFDGVDREIPPRVLGSRVTFADVDVSGVQRLRLSTTTTAGATLSREFTIEVGGGERTFSARVSPRAGIVGSTVTLDVLAGAAAPPAQEVLLDEVGDGRFVDLGSALSHGLPLRVAGVSSPRVCVVDGNGAGHVLELGVRLVAFDAASSAPDRRVLDLPGGAARAVAWSESGPVALTDRLLAVDLRTGETTTLAGGLASADALAADDSGAMYVGDSAASTVVRLVARRGAWAPDPLFGSAGTIGGRGAAPGRFLGPLSLAVVGGAGGDLLAVADAQRRDVQVFDRRGSLVGVAASELAGVAHLAAIEDKLCIATGAGPDRGLLLVGADGQRIPVEAVLGSIGEGGPVRFVATSGPNVLLLGANTLTVLARSVLGAEIVRVLPAPDVGRALAIADDSVERVRILHGGSGGLIVDTLLPEPAGYRPVDALAATIAVGRAGILDDLRASLVGKAAADFDAGRGGEGFAAAARAVFADFDEWHEVDRVRLDRATLAARQASSGRWVRLVLRHDAHAGRWLIER